LYRVVVSRSGVRIIIGDGGKVVVDASTNASDLRPFLRVSDEVLAAVRAWADRRRTGAGTGTGTDTGTGTGAGSGGAAGTTTPASWAGASYLMEIAALVGWTGPSSTIPGVNYAVRQVTLDGVSAPAIDVVSASGTKTVTPNMPEWTATALEVITAKAVGVAAQPGPQGTMTVTGETISGQDYLPSGEGDVPSSGDGQGISQPVSVSDEAAPEGGIAEKVMEYKWWILGGAAAYVLANRSNPQSFPLPDALSKLVR
jgi:hypothetical protein